MADADAVSTLRPEVQLFDPTGVLRGQGISDQTNTAVSTDLLQVPPGGGGTYTVIVQGDSAIAPSTGPYNLELVGSVPPTPTPTAAPGSRTRRSTAATT